MESPAEFKSYLNFFETSVVEKLRKNDGKFEVLHNSYHVFPSINILSDQKLITTMGISSRVLQ